MCLLVIILVVFSVDIIAALKSPNDVKKELLPDRRYCGYQHSDDTVHRTNGTEISEFPWLAGLIYQDKNKTRTSCGGSLINNRYVLTAAHCLRTRPDIKLIAVRLGEYNLKNQTDCIGEHSQFYQCSDPPQNFAIESRIVHRRYSPKRLLNDIALLRLNRSVIYSDYIRPICLPTLEEKSAEIGDILTITGWGKTTYGGKQAEIKKRISASLISNEECAAADNKYEDVLTENHGCTREIASTMEHSCQGDSGGPVMFSDRGQWQLEGIVSFGILCNVGYPNDPNVYTKVAKYLHWIQRNVKP